MDLIIAKKIVTMSPERPLVEAVAIDGGRVIAAGTWREIGSEFGNRRHVTVTNLGESTVVPGFNDNHLHAMSMGQFFSTPRLNGLNRDEIVETLEELWKDAEPGELLVARGWDYPECPNPELEVLDRTFPENPVALIQYSGHGAWLNSSALRRFGIDERTRDPQGGRILRDEAGKPTGILTDDAVRPIHSKRFRDAMRSFGRAKGHLSEALRHMAEVGITSVGDNTWLPSVVAYYRRFAREGRLTVRIGCWSYGELFYGETLMAIRRFDSEWVRRGPVKLFLDGTFSTRTAWLLDGYPDNPGQKGTATHEQKWLDNKLALYARRGRQGAAHAIGDGAVRSYVDAVEKAARSHRQTRDLRIRVEHGQLIHPDDMSRMADLGMVASAQPHAALNPEKDRAILGDRLFARAYPYRSLIAAGVPLSFGSDVPGEETWSPLYGMQLAVNREGREAITAEEALRAYTEGSAHAEFAERWKGRLAPGMAADFVVLERNPLAVRPEEISSIRLLMTVVDGRAVYDAPNGYASYGRTIAESAAGLSAIPSARGGEKSGSQ